MMYANEEVDEVLKAKFMPNDTLQKHLLHYKKIIKYEINSQSDSSDEVQGQNSLVLHPCLASKHCTHIYSIN